MVFCFIIDIMYKFIILLLVLIILFYSIKNLQNCVHDVKTKLCTCCENKSIINSVIDNTNPNVSENFSDNDNMQQELDVVDIKNVISGKSPESVYDKSINFKSVIANKGSGCGRADDELLEAALNLDSLLDCEFKKLNADSRVNYLYYKYFKGDDEEKQQYFDSVKQKKENEFIANLPYGDDCDNKKSDCEKRALAGECVINPKSMLYDCAKSCRACALTDENKTKIIDIIKSRQPYSCIYYDQ